MGYKLVQLCLACQKPLKVPLPISLTLYRINAQKQNYRVVGRKIVPPNGAPCSNPCILSMCYVTGQEGTGLRLKQRLLLRL